MEVFWAAFGGGAAAGGVVLLVELFRIWADRARLEVATSIGMMTGGKELFGVTVRNPGRRPVYLAQVVIQLEDKASVPYIHSGGTTLGPGLPLELLPGAKAEFYFDLRKFHVDAVQGRDGKPPRGVVVTDALGKKYFRRINPFQYGQWIRLLSK